MSKYVIYVEGNIASGKSTLINYLKDRLEGRIEFFLEPIDKWKNCNGINLLKLMYDNPKKYSFHLQSYIQQTMAEIQLKQSEYPIKVTERSLLSERYVFIESLIENQLISELELEILDRWFKLLSTLIPKVDEIIYLRAKPEKAFEQLRKRDRLEEKGLTLTYLEQLHLLHEKWLITESIGSLHEANVTVIEQNFDSESLNLAFQKIVERLKNVG